MKLEKFNKIRIDFDYGENHNVSDVIHKLDYAFLFETYSTEIKWCDGTPASHPYCEIITILSDVDDYSGEIMEVAQRIEKVIIAFGGIVED